jgi:hypothetical protein
MSYCQAEYQLEDEALECDRPEHDPTEAHRTGEVWWFDCRDLGHDLTPAGAPPTTGR